MTPALAAPPTNTIGDLLLVRMALSKAGAKQIRKELGKFLEVDMSADTLDDLRNELTVAGFLTKGKRNTFALTDAGHERALRFLGVTELPPKMNWSTLIARILFPRAAGLSATAAAKLDRGDNLAAFVLKRKYGLGDGAGSTVNQVAEAVACKELGFPEETTLAGLLCAVLSKLMGSDRLTREQFVQQLPLFQTGLAALKADAVRFKVVRDWLGRRACPIESFDLPVFAATVRALAASSPPQDRFHDNKVFIAALWRASQGEPNFPRLSLPEFKQRLVEANSSAPAPPEPCRPGPGDGPAVRCRFRDGPV